MFSITVYLDLLFLLNWGMNWWLLWATGIVARRKVRLSALSLSAAIGSLAAFLWLLIPVSLPREILYKSLVAICMVQICFLPETFGLLARLSGSFVLLSSLLAGITYALALTGTARTGEALPRVGWYMVIGGPLLMTLPLKGLWAAVSRYFRRISHSTLFRFRLGEVVIEQEAELDTGNDLHEPLTYRPVVVLDFALVRDWLPLELRTVIHTWQESEQGLDNLPDWIIPRVSLIPFSSVSGTGVMMGLRPEYCELWAGGQWHKVDAVVGFAPGTIRLAGKAALLPLTIWPVEIG